MREHTLYECGICDCLHPWKFNGDCRDDSNRFSDAEHYATINHISAYDVDVMSWEDRLQADITDYDE